MAMKSPSKLVWGNWSLEPDEMWGIEKAEELHKEFHDEWDPDQELYTDVLEALDGLFQGTKGEDSTKPKVWRFLTKWGHVPPFRFSRSDSDRMVEKLKRHHDSLINCFRSRFTIMCDLSEKVTIRGDTRTVAGWMQFLLRDVSEVGHSRQVVATSKLLHASIPRLYVMFDNPICETFFGTSATAQTYCGLFLPLAKAQIELLREAGLSPDPNKVCRDNWAKFIDEMNWTWANRR